MPTTRQRRVQEMLVQEISEIVRREMKDPRVGFVTLTEAEVSADLRHARVFFSVLGDAQQQEDTGKALNRAAGFIRGEFARRAQMRYVPEIRFEYDPSAIRALRISQLLEEVREDDERPISTGGPDETGGGGDKEGD